MNSKAKQFKIIKDLTKERNALGESHRAVVSDMVDLAAEVSSLKNINRDLLAACNAFMKEWNSTLQGDFEDSPLEAVACKCRSAILKAQSHLTKD
jgi:hypothetical protein